MFARFGWYSQNAVNEEVRCSALHWAGSVWSLGWRRIAAQAACEGACDRTCQRPVPYDVAELDHCAWCCQAPEGWRLEGARRQGSAQSGHEVQNQGRRCQMSSSCVIGPSMKKPVQSLQVSSKPPMPHKRALPGAANSGSDKTSPAVEKALMLKSPAVDCEHEDVARERSLRHVPWRHCYEC